MYTSTSKTSSRLGFFFFLIAAVSAVLMSNAVRDASALQDQTGLPVVPRTDTPRLVGGTVTDQALVGDLVIVVGTFESVVDTDGTELDQKYLVAYNIDSGAVDRDYDPVFDAEVIAVEADGLGGVVVGGKFKTIDGEDQLRLARLDNRGQRVRSFKAEADAKVAVIAVGKNRVYFGGPFNAVKTDGTWTERGRLAAVMVADGALDTKFDFPIDGAAGRGGELSVKGLGIAGDDLVISHSGLEVAGQRRVGAAIIDLTPVHSPTLRAWQTDFYDTNSIAVGLPLANTEAAVSPDGTYFVVVHSGGDQPLSGRDAAVRFPVAGGAGVEPDWISRHFDSMFAVGISDKAVFVGGHFQYQEAPGSPEPFPGDPNINYGAGTAGQGAAQLGNQVVARQQIGALDPETGKSFNWNPGADAAIGVESLVVIDRGLLVGQDGDTLGSKNIGRHGFFDIERDIDPEPELNTLLTSHFNGELVDQGAVVFSGTATDDQGIGSVQLAIREVRTGKYVQPDGSLGEWIGIAAAVDQVGAQNVSWTATVPMNTLGLFTVQAKAFTIDGRKDRDPALTDVEVRPANDLLPNLDFDPVKTTAGRVELTGSANDDRGIASVRLSVQDLNSGLHLQPNGSFGPQGRSYAAVLGAPGLPETTWSAAFDINRDGRFRISAEVIDTAGQDDGKFEYVNVTIAVNDAKPEVVIDQAGVVEVVANGTLTITGTVIEDTGLEYVQVRVMDQLTGDGTRPNNSFGSPATWVKVNNVDGAANRTFSYTSPPLPSGIYTVHVAARDQLGQTTTMSRLVEVGPVGDVRPVSSVNERYVPDAERNMTLTGRMTDSQGVQSGQVYVRDFSTKQWIGPDGSSNSSPVAHAVTLANPGAKTTSFTWTWEAPIAGRYAIYSLATDTEGQRSQVAAANTTQLWNLVNDAVPVVGRNAPADGETLNGSQLFVTGRATDDVAVTAVRVLVRRTGTADFLRPDGTFGRAAWHRASLTNANRPGTNWDFVSSVVPAGNYTVTLRVTDSTGRYVDDVFTVTLNR
jgi:trimeric autotransporter adhesin